MGEENGFDYNIMGMSSIHAVTLKYQYNIYQLVLTGTYDVVNTTYCESVNNSICLITTFHDQSQAQGVLYILFMGVDEGINFTKSYYYPIDKESAEIGTKFYNLSTGYYTILSYDIEYDNQIQRKGNFADITHYYIPGVHIG